MEVDTARLLQHLIPLVFYTGMLWVYLHGMSYEIRSKLSEPPWTIINYYADNRNDPDVVPTAPRLWLTAIKVLIALVPWVWWACQENAPSSVYWKISAALALAILAPPILFPYLDVTYDESIGKKILRWCQKIVDVILKKWTVALLLVGVFWLTGWDPASLFMPFRKEGMEIPTAANVLAITAVIAILLRGMFLSAAKNAGPFEYMVYSVLSYIVTCSVFILVFALSPPGQFFASIVALGIGGGFFGVLIQGIADSIGGDG